MLLHVTRLGHLKRSLSIFAKFETNECFFSVESGENARGGGLLPGIRTDRGQQQLRANLRPAMSARHLVSVFSRFALFSFDLFTPFFVLRHEQRRTGQMRVRAGLRRRHLQHR